MGNEPLITLSRNANVVIAKQPDYICVSKADWERLSKKVELCKSKTNWWINIAFTSFGISGSALLSYLTLPLDNNSAWVTPTLICIALFFVVIGIICIVANRREEKFSISNIKDIKDVICEIEQSLAQSDDE